MRLITRALRRPGRRLFTEEASHNVPPKRINPEHAGSQVGAKVQITNQLPDTSIARFIYVNFFRTMPSYAFTIIVAAVFLDKAFFTGSNWMWRQMNKGKFFDEVIPVRFPNLPPGTEPDTEGEEE